MLSDRGANLDIKPEDVGYKLVRGARFMMRAGHWNTEGLFPVNKKLIEFAKSAEGVFAGVGIGWSACFGWTARAKETAFAFLPSTDFFFANEAEIEPLCLNAKEGAQELLDKNCKNVIVHQGARGSSWIRNDFELSCPSRTVKSISLTGVGAVFNAGFIYAFLVGKDAEECLNFVNAYV